jgi:hypothetical protein
MSKKATNIIGIAVVSLKAHLHEAKLTIIFSKTIPGHTSGHRIMQTMRNVFILRAVRDKCDGNFSDTSNNRHTATHSRRRQTYGFGSVFNSLVT